VNGADSPAKGYGSPAESARPRSSATAPREMEG
jgi:hypothetical protein